MADGGHLEKTRFYGRDSLGVFYGDKQDPKDTKSVGIVLIGICSQIEIFEPSLPQLTAVYFDIKKCFDKMVLKEAMKELWLKGIQGKHWRLIYKLNSNNILTPITDIGECDPVKVPEMIKQGSVLGSVISAITIDSLT